MPAQKRPLPSSASPGTDGKVEEVPGADAEGSGGGRSPKQMVNGAAAAAERDGGSRREKDRRDDSDAEDEEDEGDAQSGGGGGGGAGDEDRDSDSSQSEAEMDDFVLVKLMDIRKEVQCPICLDNLKKKMWQGSEKCKFCGAEENIDHLIFHCPMSVYLWNIVKDGMGGGLSAWGRTGLRWRGFLRP